MVVAVLAAAFCLSSAPAPQSPATSMAVRVASYNTWLLPFGADETEARNEAMGLAIEALEPDVVCLQEIWLVRALEPVAEALSARLPEVATGGGGLAILSRWPLRDTTFDEYPDHPEASFLERLAGKGWLTTIADTPAGPLRIINTHLIHDTSEGRVAHAAQLAVLVEAVRDQTDLPTILCGDLNVRAFRDGETTDGFALLLSAGFTDAALYTNGQREGTRVGWPRDGRVARSDPDYVLFRNGATGNLSATAFRQALDSEETALSDHNLQLADFLLELPAIGQHDATQP
jgi:endonuclease/exonuclease/phosphatase family metal-dependent hydrolase